MTVERPRVRVGIVDVDMPLVRAVTKRLAALDYPHWVLASALPEPALEALCLDAVVVDPVALEPGSWMYLGALWEHMPSLGVLICTERSTLAERVRALRLGADDWIAKPCHPDELIGRIEAGVRAGRRLQDRPGVSLVASGGIEIVADKFQAAVDGVSLALSRREFEVLQLLAAAEGRVLAREEI